MNISLATLNLWSNDASWIWALVQAVAVVISLFFISRQIRIQTASHVVQSLSTISARWHSETMIRARHDVCVRWLAGHRSFDGVAQYVAEFYEELGLYLKIRAISKEQMWQAQSWYIEHYYWMFNDGIDAMRAEYKDGSLYTGLQSLFGTMIAASERHHAPTFKKTDDDIRAFIKTELAVARAFFALKEERFNQSLEPTPVLGTSVAEQPLVPSTGVAHLER